MLNIREPVLALDFDEAVMRRLLIWDKDVNTALFGGGGEQTDEADTLEMIPTYAGGVNGR